MMVLPLIVLLSSALCAAQSQLALEKRQGVTLETDVPEQSRNELFLIVEQTQAEAAALLDRLGIRRKSRQLPRVKVFAHESDYEEYKRRTRNLDTDISAISYYNPKNREVVTTWENGSDEARAQLRRQCARQVLLQYATSPSNWFEEGFAGYFEGLLLDRYGDVMDDVNGRRLEFILNSLEEGVWCPLYELMDLQDVEYYGLAGAQQSPWSRSTLYAQSWSLLFFLLHSKEPAATSFLKMEVARLDSGRWNQSDYQEKLKSVEPLWIEYLRDGAYSLQGELVRKAWETMGQSEFYAARMNASRALDLDGECRSARRVLAWILYAEDEYESAITEFDLLIASRADQNALEGKARCLIENARLDQQDRDAREAIRVGRLASAAAPAGRKHSGLLLAADAAELIGDIAEALSLVREARRLRELPDDAAAELQEREDRLIKLSIGK